MQEPPGLGPYPPPYLWRFPPPPVSRLWLVAAIVAGVLGLSAFVGATAYLGANATRDIPGFIDDPELLEVVSHECRLMRSTVRGLPEHGSLSDRLDTLRDQNTAVLNMVDRIREVGPKLRRSDQPLDAWLADWEALVTDREKYVGDARDGRTATFRVPRSSDGEPITERMNIASEGACTVPKVLLRPDLVGTRPA